MKNVHTEWFKIITSGSATQEIAGVAWFLDGPDASYITGWYLRQLVVLE